MRNKIVKKLCPTTTPKFLENKRFLRNFTLSTFIDTEFAINNGNTNFFYIFIYFTANNKTEIQISYVKD